MSLSLVVLNCCLNEYLHRALIRKETAGDSAIQRASRASVCPKTLPKAHMLSLVVFNCCFKQRLLRLATYWLTSMLNKTAPMHAYCGPFKHWWCWP